jgi:hypothetical protein
MKKPTSITERVLGFGVVFFIAGFIVLIGTFNTRGMKYVQRPDGTKQIECVAAEPTWLDYGLTATGLAMILGSGSYMIYRKVKGSEAVK